MLVLLIISFGIIKSKKRGKAINNTLNNFRVRQGGQKPRIKILPGMLRPVGKWSSQFATEVGILCCKQAPLSFQNWILVKKKNWPAITTMHEHILTKFDIDLHILHVKRVVTSFLGQRFREFRYRMHKYYKRAGSDHRRLEKPYDGVSQEDWK
ncbi:hypothetical protein IFM89_035227 [Coptis chinensis]|uniref:Uncharacterized protein n=1 Tax=Coptis chinensis TaxID=261450 RepID=A0A835IIP5_9MAGN|nr:hypothetical protein IFM89_035227 [Coptis chinensis]